MQFKSLLVLASIVTLAFGADVGDVLSDLNNVKNAFTTLENAIRGFSNSGGAVSSILLADNISDSLVATQSVVDQTTADARTVTPTPFSESDGLSILETVNGIKPIIEDGLTQLVAMEPALAAVPSDGIISTIRDDLTFLSGSTTALANVLLAATPADLLSQGNAAANEIEAAFQTAIIAFT